MPNTPEYPNTQVYASIERDNEPPHSPSPDMKATRTKRTIAEDIQDTAVTIASVDCSPPLNLRPIKKLRFAPNTKGSDALTTSCSHCQACSTTQEALVNLGHDMDEVKRTVGYINQAVNSLLQRGI